MYANSLGGLVRAAVAVKVRCERVDSRMTWWGRTLDEPQYATYSSGRCRVVFSDEQHAANLRYATWTPFVRAYIAAALFSTNDNSDESGGDPLDDNYGVEDIERETLARMVADCIAFCEANWTDLDARDGEQGGHDFWLTREGHGCGFWDGDWPAGEGKRLTAAAKAFGSFSLCVGDDGAIHHG